MRTHHRQATQRGAKTDSRVSGSAGQQADRVRVVRYWLMKTEPNAFSIDDLKNKGREHWDGVRNYQARNNMKAMKKGDLVLIYHSGAKPAVVGMAQVAKASYPDFTALDPKSSHFDPKSTPQKSIWEMVDIGFKKKFTRAITLE